MDRISSNATMAIRRWWTALDPGPRAAAVLGFSLVVLAFHPGYMSNDSFTQLAQARSGEILDSHPPVLSFIWSIVDDIVGGPFGMLILQNLMFWSGAALIAAGLPVRRWIQALAALGFGLFPPIFGLLGTIWKDIWFLGALMMAVGLIVRSKQRRSPYGHFVLAFGFLVLATSMRHNAAAAVLGIALWGVSRLDVRILQPSRWPIVRWSAAAALVTVVSFLLSSFASGLIADRSTHFWQVLAVYDVSGVSVDIGENLFTSDTGVLRGPTELADLEQIYTPRSLLSNYREVCGEDGQCRDSIFVRTMDGDELDRLFSLWMRTIIENPGSYLEHRWNVFAEVIGLTDDHLWGAVYRPKIAPNDLGLEFDETPFNDGVTSALMFLVDTPVYRVWIYGIILIGLIAAGIGVYRRHSDTYIMALSLSGFLYVAGYFFVAPSPDFRYNIWGIESVLLVGAYAAAHYGKGQWTAAVGNPSVLRVNE